MLDMSKLKRDYFKVTLPDGAKLDLASPKMKVFKRISTLANITTMDEESFTNLAEAILLIINKNKQEKTFDMDFIEEHFDFGDLQVLLTEYFTWVGNKLGSKN